MSLLESRASQGKKFIGVLLIVILAFTVYSRFQDQAVTLPPEALAALQSHVPPNRWEGGEIEAKRSGQGYTVDIVHEEPGGRRIVYKYVVSPDLTVTDEGMTVGLMDRNPMNVLLALVLGAALLGYAAFHFSRVLFSRRCPACRTILSRKDSKLFGGEIGVEGDNLAPIILITHACEGCGYKHKKVRVPGEFRAGSTKVATLVRPDLQDDLEERTERFMQSRKLTYEKWQELLAKLKEEHEGEERP
jgi:hypothetical protein